MRISETLERMGACPEAVEWAQYKTVAEAWESCNKEHWMKYVINYLFNNDLLTKAVWNHTNVAYFYGARMARLYKDRRDVPWVKRITIFKSCYALRVVIPTSTMQRYVTALNKHLASLPLGKE